MNESIGVYQKSLDLDKTELNEQQRLLQVGKSYIYQRKYSKSKKVFNTAIKVISKHYNPILDQQFYQAMPYIYMNEIDEAVDYLNDIVDNNDNTGTWLLISKAYLSLLKGDLENGLKHVDDLKKLGITDSEMKYRLVHFYIMLNDEANALKALEEAIDGGFFCYSYIKSDPLTQPIHNNSNFKQILDRAKIRHELYEKRFGDEIRSLLGTTS
jgi:tetratricopeptide (TPR) repeat protein